MTDQLLEPGPVADQAVPPEPIRLEELQALQSYFRSLEGTWKLLILGALMTQPTYRFSPLMRAVQGISLKMLTDQLARLIQQGFVQRVASTPGHAKPEYQLTERGRSLYPLVQWILAWSRQQYQQEHGEPLPALEPVPRHMQQVKNLSQGNRTKRPVAKSEVQEAASPNQEPRPER